MKKIVMALGITAMVVSGVMAAPKVSKETKAKMKELTKKYEKLGYVIRKDPKTNKPYDFGGMKVVMADWWTNPEGSLSEKSKSPVEEDRKQFRQWLNYTYNMNADQAGIGGWGSHPQTVANFCTTGGDENYVFIIDGRSISSGLKAYLFWDLKKIESVDWTQKKWLPGVTEKMTKKGAVYGCAPTLHPEPKTGMFFNKRILKEANINPETIYDMQRDGTWTWESWEKMLKATTRDIDNDGVLDVFGMANVSDQFCGAAVMSNGACYIGKDLETGKYTNHLGDEATLEALAWASQMQQNYEMPYPEGANWDWWYAAFTNGQTAFMVNAQYYCNNLADMIDDWGFVCFPAGPRGDGKYRCGQDENTFVIPGCYEKDRAEKVALILDIWSDQVPGYADDSWKEDYYPRFRDERAVDETLVFMAENGKTDYTNLISGLSFGFLPNVYGGWMTPQQAYEEVRNSWDSMIKEQNK
ncbi:MAG: ABC transporter substrate-binding protein [Treponema sp.]|nr:ABC transporter substrate-binding protein [Treponema sp.]